VGVLQRRAASIGCGSFIFFPFLLFGPPPFSSFFPRGVLAGTKNSSITLYKMSCLPKNAPPQHLNIHVPLPLNVILLYSDEPIGASPGRDYVVMRMVLQII